MQLAWAIGWMEGCIARLGFEFKAEALDSIEAIRLSTILCGALRAPTQNQGF
jgi:hypothetical protein